MLAVAIGAIAAAVAAAVLVHVVTFGHVQLGF
jgi:hypothetical protein